MGALGKYGLLTIALKVPVNMTPIYKGHINGCQKLLTNHFRKVLTPLLCKIEKTIKTLNFFFFHKSFPKTIH